jgi:hypothetical protein
MEQIKSLTNLYDLDFIRKKKKLDLGMKIYFIK